ncbi:hypothetical protein K439DRAFT_1634696 [Ramaria rubella]|nr:hypothetical protein K439DRAFT_1634696 [Ramaria rubella]
MTLSLPLYAGAPDAEPTKQPNSYSGGTFLEEHNLHAVNNAVPESGPANHHYLDFTKLIDANEYLPPDLPTILDIIANNFTFESDFSLVAHVLAEQEFLEKMMYLIPIDSNCRPSSLLHLPCNLRCSKLSW